MAMRAIFRGSPLEGKPCIIRDFCTGGFFLSWPDDEIGSQIIAIKESLPGERFSVEFTVKHKKSGDKAYSIDFEVVRVFQGGMGVSFVDPDQNVLDVLIKIADVTQKKKQKESDNNTTSDVPDDQTTFFNKSIPGQVELERNLKEILRSFLKKLDNKLIVLFKEATEETEKFEYFNARETFKADLNQSKIDILQAISAQLEDKPALKWEKTFDESVDGNSLTLVNEKEFETYLAITGIISDAEADNRLLLFRVAKKLSDLFNTDFDEGLNPIGFSRLFHTIDAYLQYKQFGYKALKEAYLQMEEVLIPELVVLYENLSKGVEAIPESKSSDQFSRETERSSSSSLDEKVNPGVSPQPGGNSGQASGSNQFANSPDGGFQNQTMYQSGDNVAFPTLEGNSPSSQVTRNAGGLAQTLMALKKSVGVPDTLHNLFQGPTDTSNHPLNSDEEFHTEFGGMSGGGMSGGGMSGGGMSGGGMSGGGMSGGGMSGGGMSGGGMSGGGMSGTAMPVDQQQNILQFLDKIQQEDNLSWQNGETISDVTGRLSPMLFGAQQQIDEEAQSALSLAGGVLNFLKEDEYLSNSARQDLKRMQTVLYKQAVSEGGLFQERSNPLRNIINTLEQLDKKGGYAQPETRQVVDELIGEILSLENYDKGNLDSITNDLNGLLDKQINGYESRVEQVAEQCDLEQTMLKDYRKDDEQDQAERRSKQPDPTGEYKVWQNRAKSMSRGDSIVIDDGHEGKKHLSLAWTGPDSSQFVFVDGEGNKAANMTQQELIVRLLKGTAELTDENEKPLFDRAIVSSLFNAYDEVKQQIIHDAETGLLNEEKYKTELKLVLENAIRDHVEHAFFYLELPTALSDSSEENDELIAYLIHTAELVTDVFGEQSLTGRLGDNSLGIISEFMSREGALILAETLLKSLEDNSCEFDDAIFSYPVSVGITVINDQATDIEGVISQASSACEKARELGENQAWLHEEILRNDEHSEEGDSETESIDWQFWLEDYSQPDEAIPLYGQAIALNGDTKAKPLFHIFPADEDENGAIRTPTRFIRASADSELITLFEKQLISNSLQWMVENRKQLSANARCLITLSGKTINSKGLLDYVIEQLTEKAVPPGKICFEIPGSPIGDEQANIYRFIRTLSEFGCRFSLGQFGSDGLSQEALKLPADYICIDEILTSDVVESAQSYGLIKSINDIAHMMEKQTVVPQRVGDDTLELLREMNINYITSSESEEPNRLNPVSVEDA